MEVAEYGDTEITATELKSTIDKHKQCDKDKVICKMEEEFDVRNLLFIICNNIFNVCYLF